VAGNNAPDLAQVLVVSHRLSRLKTANN